jgi:hypothetical protein
MSFFPRPQVSLGNKIGSDVLAEMTGKAYSISDEHGD